MKISVITVCYNASNTIERTIKSLLSQEYSNIEYIVIDGCSNDSTMSIINKYKENIAVLISEKDQGIYDAINKGINLSTGEIIGILNADDEFSNNNVLSLIANEFKKYKELDCLYGNVCFINSKNNIVRYYSGKKWNNNKFKWGYMPPHPSFYCTKRAYINFGIYSTEYEIASDYELMIRFLKINFLKFKYLDLNIVTMKLGGVSTSGVKSILKLNYEIYKACKKNGLYTNYLMIYSKYIFKIFEFLPFFKR